MFTWVCIVIAIVLTYFSDRKYKRIAVVMSSEFMLIKLVFLSGVVWTQVLNPTFLYLAYMIVQALALSLMCFFGAGIVIMSLIFANLTYNLLMILQHTHVTVVNFHDSYSLAVGLIMVLELIYLLWITDYVSYHRRKYRYLNSDRVNCSFFLRRRIYDRGESP